MAKTNGICSVPNCNRPDLYGPHGYCSKHHQRFRKHGTTDGKERAAHGEGRKWLESLIESDECIEWPFAPLPKGYGSAYLNGNTIGAHRLSYILHKGDPGDLFVMHTCDNPPCCNPRHLVAGTHMDNMQDKIEKGRSNKPKGEEMPQSKLTDQDIRDIRLLLNHGMVQHRIAMFYGLHQVAVSEIKTGKIWKHVI